MRAGKLWTVGMECNGLVSGKSRGGSKKDPILLDPLFQRFFMKAPYTSGTP